MTIRKDGYQPVTIRWRVFHLESELDRLKEAVEFIGLMMLALIAAAFGFAAILAVYVAILAVYAAPFIAIGLGVAMAVKAFMWIIGWPA